MTPSSTTVAETTDPGESLVEGLAALSRQVGRPVSARSLRVQATRDRTGAYDPESLRAALRAGGLAIERLDLPADALRQGKLPALAALRDGRFRVISSADALVSDDMTSGYAGWCLRLEPMARRDDTSGIPDKPSAHGWFWSVLWKLRAYYAHVAVATLVINVLSIAVSLYTMNVYDRVVPNRTYETLWVLTIGTIGALGFEFVARTLRGLLADVAGKRADYEISSELFRRVLDSRLIDKPASAGAAVNNLREFEAVRDVLTSATLTALIDLPFFLLFVAVIFSISPTLAVIPLVAVAAVVVFGALAQRPMARHIRESMREGSQRQGLAVESLEGLETLKVNNATGRALQRWEWYTASVATTSMKSRHLSNMVINGTMLVQQAATVATVTAGVYLIHAGQLSMGGLIGVVILCGRAIAPIGQLAGLAVRIQQARSAFSGLQSIMNKSPERDPQRTFLSIASPRGDVELAGVDFSHDPQGPSLFRGLNLSIKAGERVAILGRTGSGKSTLLRLVSGLYTPTGGLAMLDGVDLRQLDPVDTRAAIGLMPQDARLFLGTLRDNLELARVDRSAGDDRLLEVLRQFGLDRFIARHPRGLDMPIGEDGAGLSTGQKRMVGLARLALRDPAVALLDEPSSGLDATTEKQVLGALARWAAEGERRRTLVIVTHRPAALEIVDRIVVLEAGRIVLDAPRAKALEQLAKGITVAPESVS